MNEDPYDHKKTVLVTSGKKHENTATAFCYLFWLKVMHPDEVQFINSRHNSNVENEQYCRKC